MTRRRASHWAQLLVCVALLGVFASPVWANITLGWGYVEPGVGGFVRDLTPPMSFQALDTVNIGLFTLRTINPPYVFNALEVIFQWDNSLLQLLGINDSGGAAAGFYTSAFLDDTWNINEAFPPQDGNGIYTGWSMTDVSVPVAGVLVTTLQFKAKSHLGPQQTQVSMLANLNGGVTRADWGFQAVLGGLGAPIPVATPEPTMGLALLTGALMLLGLGRRRPSSPGPLL